MKLLAVYCRILLSTLLPASLDSQTWVATAPAWVGYTGEVDKRGRLIHQFGPHRGGQLTIRYDTATGRANISGPLQCYAQGSNVSSFPWPEALATCEALASALLIVPAALRLHVLETGVTVPLSAAPTAFLAQLAHGTYGPLQTQFYAKEPPTGCAQPLQYVAGFEQYRVKVYDKGTYNRLQQKPLPPGAGHALRFEIHYRKSKKAAAVLGWNGTLTLANLMQPEVFARLNKALLNSWHQIHLPPQLMDFQGLSIDECALLVAGSAPGFWQYAKENTPIATYKRKRALFHRLQKAQVQDPASALPHTMEIEHELRSALPAEYQIC